MAEKKPRSSSLESPVNKNHLKKLIKPNWPKERAWSASFGKDRRMLAPGQKKTRRHWIVKNTTEKITITPVARTTKINRDI